MVSHAIIPAGRIDAPALRKLEEACFPAVDVFKPRQFRHLLRSPSCRVLVIQGVGGVIRAEVIGLLRHSSTPSGRIYKIAVHPSARGQGLGRLLLEAIETEFRQAGVKQVVAEVRVGNAGSRSMFEACGYVAGETLPGYYPDGEDGLKFRKTLKGRCLTIALAPGCR